MFALAHVPHCVEQCGVARSAPGQTRGSPPGRHAVRPRADARFAPGQTRGSPPGRHAVRPGQTRGSPPGRHAVRPRADTRFAPGQTRGSPPGRHAVRPRADTWICPYYGLAGSVGVGWLRCRSRLCDDVIAPLLQIAGDLAVEAGDDEDGGGGLQRVQQGLRGGRSGGDVPLPPIGLLGPRGLIVAQDRGDGRHLAQRRIGDLLIGGQAGFAAPRKPDRRPAVRWHRAVFER